MKNSTLFKEKNESLLIIFKGDFFDGSISSAIIERQLFFLRRYAEEQGVKEEDVLIKIKEGSIVFEIAAGMAIASSAINILSADYDKIGKNIKSASSTVKKFIKSLLEPVEQNNGSEILFKKGKDNKEIKRISSEDAKKILSFFPDESPKQKLILMGTIFGVRKDSRFFFRTDSQKEEIRLSFTDDIFQNTESIKNQFNKYVQVGGVAKINKKGIITSMKVNTYKQVSKPQQKFNFKNN